MNKSTNEYYINPNKKPSVFSYINNKDVLALQSINPVSYKRFTDELMSLNAMIADALNNPEVGYVVFNTMDDCFVKEVNESGFILEKIEGNTSPLTRSSYAQGVFMYNSRLLFNFTAGKKVLSDIRVSLTIPAYYLIQMQCKIGATKIPKDSYRDNLVVLSGTGLYDSAIYTWTATDDSDSIDWEFECYGASPRVSPIATVNFCDSL